MCEIDGGVEESAGRGAAAGSSSWMVGCCLYR